MAAAEAPAQTSPDPFDEAMARKKEKDFDGAVKILKSLKKDPSLTKTAKAKVLHQLAACTASAGDAKQALVYYENLLALHPTYGGRNQAMWEAALLYIKTGDKKRARSLLEKLSKTDAYGDRAKKKLKELD